MNVYKKVNKNVLSIVLESRDLETERDKLVEEFHDAMDMREEREISLKLRDIRELPSNFGVVFLSFLEFLKTQDIPVNMELESGLMDILMELNLGEYVHSIQVLA
ncbi:MAG: hypothetical protein H7A24_05665 [Leptospiraceae bacterium]|nr:hypothetical protein [Leptospiraceae bacterium]MCP5511346.1 hypothetical protein [Leptospiraceae bacterium]